MLAQTFALYFHHCLPFPTLLFFSFFLSLTFLSSLSSLLFDCLPVSSRSCLVDCRASVVHDRSSALTRSPDGSILFLIVASSPHPVYRLHRPQLPIQHVGSIPHQARLRSAQRNELLDSPPPHNYRILSEFPGAIPRIDYAFHMDWFGGCDRWIRYLPILFIQRGRWLFGEGTRWISLVFVGGWW